jgi:type I restriction enzyme M protein
LSISLVSTTNASLADGWSLDGKRQPLLLEEKLGVTPLQALSEAEHAKNNLPDALARWKQR